MSSYERNWCSLVELGLKPFLNRCFPKYSFSRKKNVSKKKTYLNTFFFSDRIVNFFHRTVAITRENNWTEQILVKCHSACNWKNYRKRLSHRKADNFMITHLLSLIWNSLALIPVATQYAKRSSGTIKLYKSTIR